ncbi:hypothetical protein UA08_06520 [Talaromyces atroroseus]|uniref:Major facilitator superfamily (MFS) profile domain-containing protein n=1 Tax=Talaromyces atroroseus TaxID=1441469 RepID=A0A225AWR4_TALAT|nr:hypothetical protein UA08_06520 [Talaromyces atroroseus]OKL57937.1 hypothetical protein UA08_06520 [Talaromyces atroroseus]
MDENTPLIAGENRSRLNVTVNQPAYETVHRGELPPQHGSPADPASDENVESQDASASSGMFAHHFVNVTPSQFWWIFGGIEVGYLIGFFDSTFMASSHPVITSDFHASNSASWLSTAFLLTSTALLPLFGRISDVVGRRPVYLFSIAVFFVTTAWCALAQSIGSFIVARAFCGLGAGGVFSMGMIICSDIVRLEYRGVYQSGINMILGIGGALGYAGGGALCDRLGWRGAFAIQLPFIFAYLLIAIWTTPRDLGRVDPKNEFPTISQLLERIDLTGSFLLTVSVTALLIGINLGGNVLSWSHPLVLSSLGLAAVVGVILPIYESRVERPVMPIRLLNQAPHAYIIFSNFFGALAMNSIMFNIPLFFQAVKLESATNSGLHLLPVSVGITFTSVLTGVLITLLGKLKPFAVIGAALIFLGGLSTTALTLVDLPYAITLIFLSLACLGQGFAFPTYTVAILAVNKQEDQATCVTTMGLWRNLGYVLGVAVSSLVLQNSLRIRLDQVVTGPDKQSIIDVARKSVESIVTLDPEHREQVVQAYTFSLRLTFLSAVIWGLIMLFLTIMVKLPVLKRGGKKINSEDEEEE